MKVVYVLAAVMAAAFAFAPPAQAGTFSLGGYHASPFMRSWARESQEPLPQTHISVSYGDPAEYGPHSIYLPSCCTEGWTHHAIQGEFFHELGHVYDATNMTPLWRDEFRSFVGVPEHWTWTKPIRTVRWVVSDNYYIKLAPAEMFAEEYAACSLGLTQLQYQEAGYFSYGWMPPRGTDESALCDLIRQAAT